MGKRIRAVLERPTERAERPADERRLRRVPASKPALPGARIRKELHVPRTPERVWKALTDRAEVSRWLLPTNEDINPKFGHRFAFTGPDGGRIACQIVEAAPCRRLAYTWQAAPDAPQTLVTWTLTPTETGTRLTLEHENAPGFGGLLGLRACLAGSPSSRKTKKRQRTNGETKPCLWYRWSWKRCLLGSGPTTFTPAC